MSNAPGTQENPQNARTHCDEIRASITVNSLIAVPCAPRQDGAVTIKYSAVHQVKQITEWNWRQGHDAPILGQWTDAECFDDQGRADAE